MSDGNKIINFEKEVYLKYLSLVESTCYKSLRNKSQLTDAVQSTFLLYIQKQDNIDSPLSSWFYWSSINISRYINKKSSKEKELDQEVELNYKKSETNSNIEFSNLFDHLPKNNKDLLLMRFYDQLSYKEIGEKFKCSEHTARKKVDAIINYLKQKYSKKDVLISSFISQIFLSNCQVASDVVSKNFILQNTIIQQSIVKGVLKMYLIKKISVVAIIFLGLSIGSSYYLFSQDTILIAEKGNENLFNSNKDLTEKPKIIWTAMVGSNNFSATTPTIQGDILLFPCDQELYCLNKSNGEIIWKISGDFENGSPGIWKDKVVVVAKKGLQLINLKTGNIESEIDLSTPHRLIFHSRSNPIIKDDLCYLGTLNSLIKINLNSKEVVWINESNQGEFCSPTIEGDRAAVSAWCKSLCIFETTSGKMLWKKDFPETGFFSPSIQNGIVFSSGALPKETKEVILQKKNKTVLQKGGSTITNGIIPTKPMLGLIQAFKIDNGDLLWSKKIEDPGNQACLGLLGTNNGLIIGTNSQILNLDPKNGNTIWNYPIERFAYQDYSIDKHGYLYFGSDESKFIMLNLKDGKENLVINLMDYVDNKYKKLQQSISNGVKYQNCGNSSTPAIESNFAFVQTTSGLAVCIQLPRYLFEN